MSGGPGSLGTGPQQTGLDSEKECGEGTQQASGGEGDEFMEDKWESWSEAERQYERTRADDERQGVDEKIRDVGICQLLSDGRDLRRSSMSVPPSPAPPPLPLNPGQSARSP